MAVYKNDITGKWYYRTYVDDPLTNKRVQRQRGGFDLKRDALEAEAQLLMSYHNNDVIFDSINFDDIVDEYMLFQKKRLKPTTYVNYNYMIGKHIAQSFSGLKLREITRTKLEEWYKYLTDLEISTITKNKILGVLKNIMNYAEEYYNYKVRYLSTLPNFQKRVDERSDKVVVYNEETFSIFIKHTRNILEKTIFNTLFYTGMRVGELRGLTWNDISFDNHYIDINKQITSKVPGKRQLVLTPKSESSFRQIQIPKRLTTILKKWYELRTTQIGFEMSWRVFGDSGVITENRLRRMVKQITAESGLPYIKLHEFRHSYTTMLHSKGVDPKVIQAQTGHSTVQITLDTYTHITTEQSQKTIRKLFDGDE